MYHLHLTTFVVLQFCMVFIFLVIIRFHYHLIFWRKVHTNFYLNFLFPIKFTKSHLQSNSVLTESVLSTRGFFQHTFEHPLKSPFHQLLDRLNFHSQLVKLHTPFHQHLTLPLSPCHTNAPDRGYTHQYLCVLNFLILWSAWHCIQTVVTQSVQKTLSLHKSSLALSNSSETGGGSVIVQTELLEFYLLLFPAYSW
jgi:hypothetical protein